MHFIVSNADVSSAPKWVGNSASHPCRVALQHIDITVVWRLLRRSCPPAHRPTNRAAPPAVRAAAAAPRSGTRCPAAADEDVGQCRSPPSVGRTFSGRPDELRRRPCVTDSRLQALLGRPVRSCLPTESDELSMQLLVDRYIHAAAVAPSALMSRADLATALRAAGRAGARARSPHLVVLWISRSELLRRLPPRFDQAVDWQQKRRACGLPR
jgi:hypothetical protein